MKVPAGFASSSPGTGQAPFLDGSRVRSFLTGSAPRKTFEISSSQASCIAPLRFRILSASSTIRALGKLAGARPGRTRCIPIPDPAPPSGRESRRPPQSIARCPPSNERESRHLVRVLRQRRGCAEGHPPSAPGVRLLGARVVKVGDVQTRFAGSRSRSWSSMPPRSIHSGSQIETIWEKGFLSTISSSATPQTWIFGKGVNGGNGSRPRATFSSRIEAMEKDTGNFAFYFE